MLLDALGLLAQQGRRVGRWLLPQQRQADLLGLRRRRQSVHKAYRQRPISTQGLAREHQVHRGTHTQQPHGANRAAKAGMDAQLYFWQAQGQAAIVDTDAIAAGQRQFQTTPQRKPLQQRHGRTGQRGDAVAQRLAPTHHDQRFCLTA